MALVIPLWRSQVDTEDSLLFSGWGIAMKWIIIDTLSDDCMIVESD